MVGRFAVGASVLMSYCTPTHFWQTRLPKTVRPEDFEAGEVSAVSRVGSGDGTIAISRAFPKDAWAVSLTITTSGELGAAKYRYSLDGTAVSPIATIPTSGPVLLQGWGDGRLEDSGLEIAFADGVLNPSFVMGDVYSFVTVPSPAVRLLLAEAQAELDEVINNDRRLPLTRWSASLPGKVADIAAWRVLKTRGYDPRSQHDQMIRLAYDDARAWGVEIREKLRELQADESGTPVAGIRASSFPPSGWGRRGERS